MKTPLVRAITGCLFALALGASTSLLGQTSPFAGQDVGAPGHPAALPTMSMAPFPSTAAGDDIWNTADNFFYY